jgi:glycine cleavage system H protein
MIPDDLKYTDSHEWIRIEGSTATVGITDHAQEQLTDIVFVELPELDIDVERGGECGVIESCKIAAELYAPISGKITAVNEELQDHPDYINSSPYENGWIVKLEISDSSELDSLMDAAAYKQYIVDSE